MHSTGMIKWAVRTSIVAMTSMFSIVILLTAPAQAASCVGNSCVGKDPNIYCSPGYTKYYHEDPNAQSSGNYAYWQERRNDSCQSAWVRVGIDTGNLWYTGVSYQGQIQSRVGSDDSTKVYKHSPILTPTDTSQSKTVYSTMVSNGTGKYTRYCWRDTMGGSWSSWACSSWH